ncbi:hypothetical protein [Sulfodiicoccus acidiphilus]|nr:hypothetical protein [Sulfodiicoccus acidiphilus]
MTDEEISYALKRARGIIFGFGMEFRAKSVLESMNFEEVRGVDLPTHDIEAIRGGVKYFIEVKATRKSPTKGYSAHKIAQLALLDGPHMTLVMYPEPKLYLTEEVLSEPKRMLLFLLKQVKNGNLEAVKKIVEIGGDFLRPYEAVIMDFSRKYSGEETSTYLTYLLRSQPQSDGRNLEIL